MPNDQVDFDTSGQGSDMCPADYNIKTIIKM